MNSDAWRLCISPRVLLVVDQPVLAAQITRALSHGSNTTRVAPTGKAATDTLREWQPHLAIIDLDFTNKAFRDSLRCSPPGTAPIPIVALTRRGDLQTKLAAFERGVDDILTVPFSSRELVARTVAVMRRTYCAALPLQGVLRLGELEIDILNRCVRVRGHELHLTALDQSLLYLLASNAGRILTRDEILDHLWGADFAAESNVVDRHVRNLRAKLRDDWQRPRYIATVPGHGYRFLSSPAESTPLPSSPTAARRR